MQSERIPLPSGQWAHALTMTEAPHAALHRTQYHVIVVPGNPGVASFYEPFIAQLYARLQGNMSVRCVNLAGFVEPQQATQQPKQSTCAHGHGGGCAHSHSHAQAQQTDHNPPAERLYSLHEQCNFLFEYLRALHLQLQCADELARADSCPPAGSIAEGAVALLSPCLRAGSSTLPPRVRQHRFILVAHSIGSFLALSALERAQVEQQRYGVGASVIPSMAAGDWPMLEALGSHLSSSSSAASLAGLSPSVSVPIAHAFLLFPFVRMDLGPVQFHVMRLLLGLRWLPALMARLGRLVPLAVYRFVLRVFLRITSTHAVAAVYALARSRALLQQGSWFAHTEFRDVLPAAPAIVAPRDPAKAGLLTEAPKAPSSFCNDFIGAHVSRTTFYYAGKEHDCWGPQSQMRDFQRSIPDIDARLVPSVTHAWCAYVDQSATMADLVSRDLDALQLRWGQQGEGNDATALSPSALPVTSAGPGATPSDAPAVIVSRL